MSLLDPSPSGHTKWSGSLLSFSNPSTPVSLSPLNTDGLTETGWNPRPFIAKYKGTIVVAVQSFLILWAHGLQHSRLPCPPLSPGVCSDSYPLSPWWHPTNLILCRPLLLLPSIFLSIKVFSNESAVLIRWPEYWTFSINPSSEFSGLISFRIDWFELFAVQGTLKSLSQEYCLCASWEGSLPVLFVVY